MKHKYTKGIYGGLLLLLWGWSTPLLWAQQEPYFSLYRYEFNRQNPAAVGLVEGLQAQLHLRSQWLGVDGFILKSSNSLDKIVPAIAATLRGERYFSPTIAEKLQRFSSKKDIDYIDRLLLKGLSKGMKQNEIADYFIENSISLTPSAIEKRVKRLKEYFNAKTSLELMSIVSKQGYI